MRTVFLNSNLEREALLVGNGLFPPTVINGFVNIFLSREILIKVWKKLIFHMRTMLKVKSASSQ